MKLLEKYIFILMLVVATTNAQDKYLVKKASFCQNNFNEFSPAFYGNSELVFCSDKNPQVFITYTTPNNQNLIDLYKVSRSTQKIINNPKLLDKEVLRTNFNEGPATFSADGTEIYFTRTIDAEKAFGNSLRGDTAFGIFYSTLSNGVWSNPKAFKYNRSTSNTGFPFLTADGNTLYFCSDMPGGEGGMDIWKVEKRGRNWGRAENLGSVINTPGNEVSPFYHSIGRLYFASNGRHNRDDVDLFMSDFIDGEWSEPEPMEFNSRSDDFGLIINETLDTGYYSSDRRGNDDIYEFYSVYPSFTECYEQQENNYCFVFYESGSMSLDSTSLKYEWDMGDGTKIRNLRARHCFDGPGNYLIALNVIDTLTGDVYFSEATYDFVLEDKEQPYMVSPDTLVVGEEFTFDATKSYVPSFDIDSYIWDFGYGERKSGEKVVHSFKYAGEYEVKLGVTSVTESRRDEPQKKCSTKKVVVIKNE